MSLINKEILPFTAQAYDPKNDEFKEISQEDFKGSWSVVCFYPADFRMSYRIRRFTKPI